MGNLENTERKVEYVGIAKKGPSKKAEMIFTSLTFIVALLLVVFAIVPTFRTVTEINKEIKEKERITTALESKIKALNELDNQFYANKDTFKDISLIFPTSQNFSLFLANIDAIVTRNNFILSSINFSEYKESSTESNDLKLNTLSPYSVRLSVKGSKMNLINFLKDLESLPMYPVVESINYSSEVDEQGNTDFSLELRVYHVEDVSFYD